MVKAKKNGPNMLATDENLMMIKGRYFDRNK